MIRKPLKIHGPLEGALSPRHVADVRQCQQEAIDRAGCDAVTIGQVVASNRRDRLADLSPSSVVSLIGSLPNVMSGEIDNLYSKVSGRTDGAMASHLLQVAVGVA